MTPGARFAAAIEILDDVLSGQATEAALLKWARRSRFAGSRDRAAVRDIVFDGIRRKRSAAFLGGAETGRGIVLGLLRAQEADPDAVFTGEGYAPGKLTAQEKLPAAADMSDPVAFDYPDWLDARLEAAFGAHKRDVMAVQQSRAPVFLRVNTLKCSPQALQASLAAEEIQTKPHPDVTGALIVTSDARRLTQSSAFEQGFFEFQDAHSQASVIFANPQRGMRVLDLCAGGGGKTLALAAAMGAGAEAVTAYDIVPERMKDLPARAARAGVKVNVAKNFEALRKEYFDFVFVDAPCSGSGSWRRSPDGKWLLTEQKLLGLVQTQSELIASAFRFIPNSGKIAFVTCSILPEETRCTEENPLIQKVWLPSALGDGFSLRFYN